MTFAVFVAPMFSTAASQMIEAAVSLSGVRVGVVSQEPLERLAPHIASRLAGHYRIERITDIGQLETAVRALGERHGPIFRCFGAFEQLQVPLAIVRERIGIPGLSSAAATNFRDKARMKDVLSAAGVPVARHRLVGSMAEAEEFAREVGFPIVIKPPAGAGAIATQRCDGHEVLAQFLRRHPPSRDDPMLAEEFLRGTEHSIETVSIAGRSLWHSITNYYPTPLEVLENPWIQWCVLLPREVDRPAYDDIRMVASRALAALGMGTGVSHASGFGADDGSVAISEIGARPPGAQITTMISRANDIDFREGLGHTHGPRRVRAARRAGTPLAPPSCAVRDRDASSTLTDSMWWKGSSAPDLRCAPAGARTDADRQLRRGRLHNPASSRDRRRGARTPARRFHGSRPTRLTDTDQCHRPC